MIYFTLIYYTILYTIIYSCPLMYGVAIRPRTGRIAALPGTSARRRIIICWFI